MPVAQSQGLRHEAKYSPFFEIGQLVRIDGDRPLRLAGGEPVLHLQDCLDVTGDVGEIALPWAGRHTTNRGVQFEDCVSAVIVQVSQKH